MVDYLKTIEVYGIQIGMYSKQNEYMEACMYQRSRSFFHHCQRSLRFHKFQAGFALKPLDRLQSNYILNQYYRRPKFIEAVEVT